MPKSRKNRIQKNLAPVFHIYCEGEKTEPYYLYGYIGTSFPGNRRLNVIRVESTKKNTPKQLVEEAVKAKKDKNCPKGDVFWVVFDREGEQKYPHKFHQQAYDLARRNEINIAISNVCFEVWILLHFQSNTAAYNNYDDLRRNSSLCKDHIKTYDKGDKNVFDTIKDRVPDARRNAVLMNEGTKRSADPSWTEPYQWNPYSNVHELLDAIDEFGNQNIC